ncbi:MAG: hypothetical protein ACFFEJ_17220 [Candidatus Thorarchaeota archaeon]
MLRFRCLKGVLAFYLVIVLFLSPTIPSLDFQEPMSNDENALSLSQSVAPPFISPYTNASTVLNGNVTLTLTGTPVMFEWRLFSPNITQYTPGNFWTSIDLSWNVSNCFDNMVIEFKDPDHEESRNAAWYGSAFVNQILWDGSEFVQYIAYRNATYFFLNGSYSQLHYPEVDDEMLMDVRLMLDEFQVTIFNMTILTETMFPEVNILFPEYNSDVEGPPYTLDAVNDYFIVNASDPSGIASASLHGIYWDESTQQELLFSQNTSIVSGIPFLLPVPMQTLELYAELTHQQTSERIVVQASLWVRDTVGWGSVHYIDFLFNIGSPSNTSTTESILVPLVIGTIFSIIGIASVVVILEIRRREQAR